MFKENPRFWSGVLWESWILDFAKNACRMYSSPNLRSKIQELRRSLVQKGQNSRFKIPKKNSWIQGGGIEEVFSEPWILNPTPLDSRILFGILNLESYPVGFKKFFLSLESWILNPTSLDSRIIFGIFNLEPYSLSECILCKSKIQDSHKTCKKKMISDHPKMLLKNAVKEIRFIIIKVK